jgi:protein O-mannosyl-transferase
MVFKKLVNFIVPGLLILGAIVYLPGLNGPFFFDDDTNLIGNPYVQIKTLDVTSLYQAAFSLSAGPLQRPVSMASFAVNHFFAGGFHALAFKSVNLAIHLINGLLIYWLAKLVLMRAASVRPMYRTLNLKITSAAIALVWLVHPIQLTSVLYVVQRMTELAALFCLLGLLLYFRGRESHLAGRKTAGAWQMGAAVAVCWPLGLYSKESAALLPIFILVLECTLFADQFPWKHWRKLSSRARNATVAALILAIVAGATAFMLYALPTYAVRTFSVTERLMTEARVLLFYVSLILLPRLDAFGLFHDDIPISHSIFSPWTTLPSIAIIASLIAVAFKIRKSHPLVALGILWFFGGHLLESTVIALEIAHEHRNYLPSLGVLLAIAGVVGASEKLQRFPYAKALLVIAILGPGTITALRSAQWSSEREMAYYDATHHPDSAASVARYANVLLADGRIEESLRQMRRVTRLAPHEAGFLMSLQAVQVTRGGKIDMAEHQEVIHRLSTYPATAVTLRELSSIGDCVTTTCTALQPYLESWVQALLANARTKDLSFFYFLQGRSLIGQGRFNDAVEAYKRSHELDPSYMNPLLDLAELYLALNLPDHAATIVEVLREVNKRSVQKRDRSINYLADKIQQQKPTHAKPGGKS